MSRATSCCKAKRPITKRRLSSAVAAAALAAACAVPAAVAATSIPPHKVVASACNPCAGNCQSPMPGKKGPKNPCGLRTG